MCTTNIVQFQDFFITSSSNCSCQVAGLFLGMVAMGLVIDRIGRKWGSITTAGIMFVGAACCFSMTLLLFGIKILLRHICLAPAASHALHAQRADAGKCYQLSPEQLSVALIAIHSLVHAAAVYSCCILMTGFQ